MHNFQKPRSSDNMCMTSSLALVSYTAAFKVFIALIVTTMQLSTLCFLNYYTRFLPLQIDYKFTENRCIDSPPHSLHPLAPGTTLSQYVREAQCTLGEVRKPRWSLVPLKKERSAYSKLFKYSHIPFVSKYSKQNLL